MISRLPALLMLLCVTAVALTACGRKGALDTPAIAAAEARGEKAPEEGAEPEDRKFILDGLIE